MSVNHTLLLDTTTTEDEATLTGQVMDVAKVLSPQEEEVFTSKSHPPPVQQAHSMGVHE